MVETQKNDHTRSSTLWNFGGAIYRGGIEEARPTKIARMTWLLLGVIVVYFAVLQLTLRHYESGLERDSVAILERVANWHRTGVYVGEDATGGFVPPLALYCFRLPLALGAPLEQGCLFLILLFGMSVPVLSFLLARECYPDDRTGLVFAALMASNPYLHDIYNSIIRDPLFIPLALVALWLTIRHFKRPGAITACAAGIVSALALLTRYEGILLPAVFVLFALWAAFRDRSWKGLAAQLSAFLLSWAAVIFLLLCFWNVLYIAWRVSQWRYLTCLGRVYG